MKVIVAILKGIISIVNIVLILVIILNAFNLILNYLADDGYISFLDYTYMIIEEDDDILDLQANDVILIDLKLSGVQEEIIMYKNAEDVALGKVLEVTDDNTTILNTQSEELELENDQVLGKVVKILPDMGTYLQKLLSTRVLVVTIGILIITSLIQSFLNKQQVKLSPPKPNFQNLSHV